MSQFPIADMVRDMMAAGAPADAIVVAVKSMERTRPALSPGALRVRKHRQGKAAKALQSVTHVTDVTPSNVTPFPVTPVSKNNNNSNKKKRYNVTNDKNAYIESSLLDSESKKETKKNIRGTRLVEGWRPTQKTIEWTLAEIGQEAAKREIARFHDYWKSAAGAKGVKADWDATWRNWVRSFKDRLEPIQAKHQQSRVIW